MSTLPDSVLVVIVVLLTCGLVLVLGELVVRLLAWSLRRRPGVFRVAHPPYRDRNVVSMARFRDRDWKTLRHR